MPATPGRKLPSDDVVKGLYLSKGLSMAQIAAPYGATKQAVHEILKKCGVESRPRVALDPVLLRHLYISENLSAREIGLRLDKSKDAIASALTRAGIKKGRLAVEQRVTRDEIEKIYL